ncbi:MAG: tyrosine-type recombinase/integrase [Acidimicrobiales bacterium]
MSSITKWKNGKWRARTRTPEGESRSKVFDRKIDAEKWVTAVEHSKLIGGYVDTHKGRVTVAQYWATWSEAQEWRASSRLGVTSYFRNHILPAFGRRPLNTLRRTEIETWARRLPVSARTAGLCAQYLSTMLEAAVHDGLLATNPAHGAKRPKVETKPVVPFTIDELDALRDACPAWFAVAIDLGVGVGLRQSEATGLTLDRIDFLRRTVRVDQQLVSPASGDPTLGPPKTRTSYRTIPLADVVVEALARHVEHYGAGDHGLVLHLPDGRPIRRQHFGVIWRKVRTSAGQSQARFHDTRHTFASTLLAGGVSVPACAEWLGHTPGVLLSTYAHLLPGDDDRARAIVQNAFTPASPPVRVQGHNRKTPRVTGVSRASLPNSH